MSIERQNAKKAKVRKDLNISLSPAFCCLKQDGQDYQDFQDEGHLCHQPAPAFHGHLGDTLQPRTALGPLGPKCL